MKKMFLFTALMLLFPINLYAQSELNPAIYVMLDTSGSMLETPLGIATYGDGSVEHPSITGEVSRLYMAKNAISTVVNGYGEVRWGFSRFRQSYGPNYFCMCSDEEDDNTSCAGGEGLYDGADDCRMCDLSDPEYPDYDLPGEHDAVCINYVGGIYPGNDGHLCCDPFDPDLPLEGADILVELADNNESDILKWLNHTENDPGDPVGSGSDPEIRAAGGTPLGGALHDIYDRLSTTDLASDTRKGCRPYSIVLLTDGDEECGTDPEYWAQELLSTPDLSSSCSDGSECPSGRCDGQYCLYEVKTYVIGFGLNPSQWLSVRAIAIAGGTDNPISANNQDEISAAMASIIADSIKMELCNGLDDDCDGEVDEDFPKGDECDNGLLGECFRAGYYQCSDDETGVECDAPEIAGTQEVCNGLDDDCNGVIDDTEEGCPEPGPEMCNNLDDDLDDDFTDDGEDDPGVGLVCSATVGICTEGITKCSEGTIKCCVDDGLDGCVEVQTPQTEICDNLDNDCDGSTDEGVSQKCWPGGTGCVFTTHWECTGICAAGIQLCSAGEWLECQGAVTPGTEVCDGVDNDCDGSIDEELGSTWCGLGKCYHEVQNCSEGHPQTCDPMEGSITEICNDADDDCDGQVDEGLSKTCYTGAEGTSGKGVCKDGVQICNAGDWGNCLNEVVPTTETCNNLDDDCDDEVDENLVKSCYSGAAGTEGKGLCHAGSQTCSAGAWGNCIGEVTPVSEICNGIDDDCDGDVDNMGSTSCGVGKCYHTVLNCENGTPNICDPNEGKAEETCNGIDDDCDGQVDGITMQCYPSAPGCVASGDTYVCKGECSAGVSICTDNSWSACSGFSIPQGEVCDGKDNDCDDEIDEGLGTTSCGVGVCAKTVDNCKDGAVQLCDPMDGASTEICDGLDNDCDGLVDEGLSQVCYSGPEGTAGKGVCRQGVKICQEGEFGDLCPGEVVPGVETCNGQDDDCDGLTDEDLVRNCYTGGELTEDVGLCHGGTQTCSSGGWGSCDGEVVPAVEICDGYDNDCNGFIDDMGTITCGLGECNHTINVCSEGTIQTCNPLQDASDEICDGLDNDCDGQVDGLYRECFPTEETGCVFNETTLLWVCEGTCSPGQEMCPVDGSGDWGSCEGSVVPQQEICDGLDNDCDGDTDEDLIEYCYPPGSGENTGCIEQGDGTWLCDGECTVGTRTCNGGSWTGCDGVVTPTSEICDGLDNDCDGEIDEDIPGMGEPCGGVGVCAPGTRICDNGVVVCDGGGEPQPGLCDGLDNNCNGLVDEPDEIAEDPQVGAECGDSEGVCEPGLVECINGGLICVGGVVSSGEICNGLDDDCDGLTDNGDLCSVNEICYDADCRIKCDPSSETPCPAGYTCIDVTVDDIAENICYPQLAPCGGIYCGMEEVCRDGICVDPCETEPCESWESCYVNRYAGQVGHEGEDEYRCVDVSCSGPGRSCPDGKNCVEHQCIADPCASDPCEYGEEYCVRDECEGTDCSYHCEKIPYCNSGEIWSVENQACEPDPCSEVNCQDGKICVDGSCEDDACIFVGCEIGSICIQGTCVENPCDSVKCPYYTECSINYLDGSAWCDPLEGVWTPPEEGDTMTSTGNTLFGCSSSPDGKNSTVLWPFILLFAAVFFSLSRKIRYRKVLLPLFALVFVFTGCNFEEYKIEQQGKLVIPDAQVTDDADADGSVDDDADACIPSEEICDGVDNDCNGIVDDFWASEDEGGQNHFQDDIFNCGSCGNICAFNHAQASCVDGECVMGDCDTNWYNFDNEDSTGCEASCVMSSGGQEICDGVDNDCNGVVDDYWTPIEDGGENHFMDDPLNCGSCSRVCAFPNGEGSCVEGNCTLSGCSEGYADADGTASNGCECIITGEDDSTCDGVDNDCNGQTDEDFPGGECYTGPGCTENPDGTFTCEGECQQGTSVCSGGQELCQGQVGPALEICDYKDNDCDGVVDEGFDLMNDSSNCGLCGHRCTLDNALSMCSNGVCVVSVCTANHWNLDGQDHNGCEYECQLTNGGIERCDDALDNDCDGQLNEFNSETDVNNCGSCGNSCSATAPPHMNVTGCDGGICKYECANGYHDFDAGIAGCETFCVPSGPEICDGIDNDCNGATDEIFDKTTDIENCGDCGNSCTVNAPLNMDVSMCDGGICKYECKTGFINLDGLLSTGCEYECTVSNSGNEICDGKDNDCNGLKDEDSSGLPLTESCYTGDPLTRGVGECRDGTRTCTNGSYGSCLGEIIPVTDICDGKDNDCDGSSDEDFSTDSDIFNCGGCNISCFGLAPDNATVVNCSSGNCVFQCKPDYYDRDVSLNTPTDPNGCESFCQITNNGVEDCSDGVDNDCDGITDEYNGSTDVNNCGSCGNVCADSAPPHMVVTSCSSGVCNYECANNYHDFDAGEAGCETYCNPTGPEICDGIDNDCNNQIDETFDKNTDVNNCGLCGHVCDDHKPLNMVITVCSSGVCEYECSPGFIDLDGNPTTGCEYECTPSGAEVCDGVDNDCDGTIDKDAGGLPLKRTCYTGDISTRNVGECSDGEETCTSGSYGVCLGEFLPVAEICDGLDNNCNNDVDETFDLNTDILNCGDCGTSCFSNIPDNASVAGCELGVCVYTCQEGFVDLDTSLETPGGGDGCEYECTPTLSPGHEECNDLDDDCNGTIDDLEHLQAPPPGYCKTGGGCGTSVDAVCEDFEGDKRWVCQYPEKVERIEGSPNLVQYREYVCDGFDGDCDEDEDDDFIPLKGSVCTDDDYGLCKGEGVYECNGAGDGVECVIDLGSKGTPQPELCDGIDNDCDGLVDEPAWNPGSNAEYYVEDEVVEVPMGISSVFVYKYEASRPGATAENSGEGTNVRACSQPGVKPWARVTYAQAKAACERAGMRLCNADEWLEACDGDGSSNIYPYGNVFDEDICNGIGNSTATDDSTPTGALAQCASGSYDIMDMSGNLKEWTNDLVTYSSSGKSVYRVRGGSYNEGEIGLRCDFEDSSYIEDVITPYLGFRCCSTCGNGHLDEGEQCDDGNLENGDGCDALCAWDDSTNLCGDGIVQDDEDCDDGNRMSGDGCSSVCTFEQENCSEINEIDEDGDGDVNCEDEDCWHERHCDTYYQDNDGDGFSEADGDCDDDNEFIHPAAVEICNDGVDNNCNGETDGEEGDHDGDGEVRCNIDDTTADCDDNNAGRSHLNFEVMGNGIDDDCDEVIDEDPYDCDCSGSPDRAEAIGLCSGVTSISSYYDSESNGVAGSFGALSPQYGCNFLGLSTGEVWSTSVQGGTSFNENGNPVSVTGCMECTVEDTQNEDWAHPGPEGCCEDNMENDPARVRIQLVVPSNARSFSFQFIVLSAEYPEYVHTGFNDTFYAVVHSTALDDVMNVSFAPADLPSDTLQPMTINNGYFEDPRVPPVTDITGTGYEVYYNNPNPQPDVIGSSTGWLTTTSPCTPGEVLTIDFWIHDELDHIYDTSVIIDNWQWFVNSVDGPVTIK
ncbi:MAG: SUMF1/EgtB/PvdO family nonheme iron enzyme [Deltaproteobacteria bacterium]|nr:SUMF1/EgtB/PvdO family nonheme iron enzyme [Deltaproteobacteria bacterium]